MKVVSQSQYSEREWENRNHEKVLISSVELELTDGIESVIAEAGGDQAKLLRNTPLTTGGWYPFQMTLSVSSWQKQDGSTAKATRVRIVKIGNAIMIPTF